MSISPRARTILSRVFSDDATIEAIEELKADLTKKVVSSQNDAVSRQKNLDMLWGLEALVVKIRANSKQSEGDQAK